MQVPLQERTPRPPQRGGVGVGVGGVVLFVEEIVGELVKLVSVCVSVVLLLVKGGEGEDVDGVGEVVFVGGNIELVSVGGRVVLLFV